LRWVGKENTYLGLEMLSKKAKYALKALEYLARNNDRRPLLIAEIASSQRIPKKFLELILLELKKSGVLESRKGKQGGYALAREAEAIQIGEVVRLIDGPIAMVSCVSEKAYAPCAECIDEQTCGLKIIMAEVREATISVLNKLSIADILKCEDRLKNIIDSTNYLK
jgi:Rrf2 family protein